ncbi:Thiamine-monophosphate kinase [Thiorhodovibrio winogradskyi]|uniref:Thiamine-monophosphate kinase n=1 Tax=Thiorhodovibrio winogradskyi TaxID=77007 RepID=A0ABZ0S3A6_9GAMM|nr:thiamine-phosphate kinase [Thiorhodovibrio winogradskyi]
MSNNASLSEFSLIHDYLTGLGATRQDVVLDIGDDCALTAIPPGYELAFSIDTLVSGVHFFPDCNPQALGHKSLAVGLSDLAAVGAMPAWATLALTLPESDSIWLKSFATGIHELSLKHGLRVVGGDLTRGPLTISIQVMGLVRTGMAVRRSGAKPGDLILVTGVLGDAGLALRHLLACKKQNIIATDLDPELRQRLEWPQPRVQFGCSLPGIASAAIDISDGLVADLGHLLTQSACGANIELAHIPLSSQVSAVVNQEFDWTIPLCSGDDYELCFTIPEVHLQKVQKSAHESCCQATVIGHITETTGIRLKQSNGKVITAGNKIAATPGFDHFSSH